MRAFLVASTILASSLLLAAAPTGRPGGCWGGAPPPANNPTPPDGRPKMGCDVQGKVLSQLPVVGEMYLCGDAVEVVVDPTGFEQSGTYMEDAAESCAGTGLDSCVYLGTYQAARCYLSGAPGYAGEVLIHGSATLDEARARCDAQNGVGLKDEAADDCTCRWYTEPLVTRYICSGNVTCVNAKNEYDGCNYNGWEVYADDEEDARDLLAEFCEIDMHDKYGNNCDHGGMCCTPGSLTCWAN